MKRLLPGAFALAMMLAPTSVFAQAQTLPTLPAASTPLTGAELLYCVQGGVSSKCLVSTLGGGIGTIANLTVTGSFIATGLVTNADLVNTGSTVNGVVCTLGSSCTVAAAAGTLTGATLASNVLASSLTSTGTLTGGGTGAGFTLGLGTSTLTGTIPVNHGGTGGTTFTANLPLIGNGASAVAQGTRSGNTTAFVTQGSLQTSGTCAQYDASGNITSAGTACGGSFEHGGRLTLISGVPAQVSNVAGATILYYAPYKSPFIAIYNGANVTNYQFTSGPTDGVGLSLTIGSNWAATSVYDAFIALNSGSPVLCTGPVWTDQNTRASAGTLAPYNGQSANNNATAMTCRISNSATISVPQYQATYVGTIATDASGTLDFTPQQPNAVNCTPPSPTSGCGSFAPAQLYVWNEYNRIQTYAYVFDTSTAATSYTSATIRTAAGNTNNRIYYVVGQQEDTCIGWYQSFDELVTQSNASHEAYIIAGLGFRAYTWTLGAHPLAYTANGTIYGPKFNPDQSFGYNAKGVASAWWSSVCYPVGLGYEEALEQSDGNNANLFGYFGQQVLNFQYSM